METILNAPMIAEPLGLYRLLRRLRRRGLRRSSRRRRSRARSARRTGHAEGGAAVDLLGQESRPTSGTAAMCATRATPPPRAYKEAGITNPREQLSLIEVHDCFSITELVTMEDLFLSDDGRAVTTCSTASTTRGGGLPCQIDGGLKCFGHPVGASGLRMITRSTTSCSAAPGERQLPMSARPDAQPRRRALSGHRGHFDSRSYELSLCGRVCGVRSFEWT
jgi:acetyl-CoA C-acetyltransferase